MKYFSVFTFLFFVNSTLCSAQNSSIDSLLLKIQVTNDREQKLDLVLSLCKRNDTHLDTFNRYAFIADELASTSRDQVKIAYAKYNVAWAYYYLNANDSARIVIDDALEKLPKNSIEQRNIYYKLKGFKATTFQGQRRNSEALQILYPLLSEAEQFGDSIYMSQTMHQIAVIEGQQSNPQKLISWEQKALRTLPVTDSNSRIISATIFATLGKAYLQLEKLDLATLYHLKAIDVFRQENDLYNLGVVLLRQSSVYIAQKNDLEAKLILDELSALNSKIKFGEGDLNYYLSFIQYWLLIGDHDKAIVSCKEHLFGENASANESIRLSYLQALSEAYKSKGDWKNYSSTLEELIHAKDSFYKENSVDAIAEMETKYEVQKKENLIIQQEFDLSRKNLLFYGSLVLLALVLIIGWLIFKNDQRKSELKLILMQEEDKRLRIHAVKDAEESERKRIAADLHDSLGSYAASIKANADYILNSNSISKSNLELLQSNAQQMVSLLGDTIWALRKEKLSLIDISDRVKVFLNRLKPNYPQLKLRVEESIENEIEFQPNQAYHLFMIIQEAVNNAIKHSRATEIIVSINYKESWEIRIIDNGIGFNQNEIVSESGNGLQNIILRAESVNFCIQLNSDSISGTEVIIKPNTY